MNNFGNIVQRAFYMGVGIAAFAGERANELRIRAQKLADEMVARGEMNAEEARKFVDDVVKNAQKPPVEQSPDYTTDNPAKEPRQIEIVSDDEESSHSDTQKVDNLRDQVQSLQDELRRLRKE
ncbi:MAG: phasin family protein [Spirulinaceae cyanobacterium]